LEEPGVTRSESAQQTFSLHTMSASDACTVFLRNRIISGELTNGEAVVIDRVAEELGTSHTPVREAVRRLEAEGLVTYEPRRGVKVRSLNKSELEELVELRKTLESGALAKSIEVAVEGSFVNAADRLEDWTRAVEPREMLAAQWQFLRAMYEPSGLVRTLEVIEANWRLIERYHQFSWETSEATRSRDFKLKKRILAKCRARKVEEATTALVSSIEWGASIARKGLESNLGP
jgi:DNA-binding GntR family transcriptional regulator